MDKDSGESSSKLGTRPALIGLRAFESELPPNLSPFVTARLNESKKFPKALIPSGMCFTDALCIILDQPRAVLRHAIIQWGNDPTKLAHGWCEYQGNIIEGYFFGGKFVYCKYPIAGNHHPKILHLCSYFYREVLYNLSQNKGAGPWDEEIKKHVSDGNPDV